MKERMYRKMYSLLLDYELKISQLSKFIRNQKKSKISNANANEMNRLKLHRKFLKMNLKRLKNMSQKKWSSAKKEFRVAYKVANRALKTIDSSQLQKI